MFAQLVKPATPVVAAPAAAPKGKTIRRAAPKAAVKATPAVSAIKFAVQDFARPAAGNMLAAHTAAFLALSGIGDDAPVPRAMVTKVIGVRAVAYHLSKANFEATDKGLILTDKGAEFFASRAVDPELFAAYEQVFTTGAINEKVNVKGPSHVVKL